MIYGEKDYNDLYSWHEQKEKKRCPICGSIDTKRHGLIEGRMRIVRGEVKKQTQRFYCNCCHKSFTDKGYDVRTRYSENFKSDTAMMYVMTKASLSEIAEIKGVSNTSINNWIIEIASKTDEFYDFGFRNPSGYIQIDGKEVRVKGEKRVIFVASDSKSHRPVCYGIYDSENNRNAKQFMLQVKELYGAEVKGMTSDFGRGKCFIPVIKEIFPNANHQVCIFHFLRYMWLFIPRTRRSRYFWRNQVLKKMITAVIKAKTRFESKKRLDELLSRKKFFKAKYHRKFIRSIEKNFDLLTTHFEDPILDITSNVIENWNRQLERKLKNTDGFKSDTGLASFLNLWFLKTVENLDKKVQLN